MDNYSFGNCYMCNKWKPLKNGVCIDCESKNIEVPEMFKDIFNKFDKGE